MILVPCQSKNDLCVHTRNKPLYFVDDSGSDCCWSFHGQCLLFYVPETFLPNYCCTLSKEVTRKVSRFDWLHLVDIRYYLKNYLRYLATHRGKLFYPMGRDERGKFQNCLVNCWPLSQLSGLYHQLSMNALYMPRGYCSARRCSAIVVSYNSLKSRILYRFVVTSVLRIRLCYLNYWL